MSSCCQQKCNSLLPTERETYKHTVNFYTNTARFILPTVMSCHHLSLSPPSTCSFMAVNWTNSFVDREQHMVRNIEQVMDEVEGVQRVMKRQVVEEEWDFYCTDGSEHLTGDSEVVLDMFVEMQLVMSSLMRMRH